MGRLAEQVRVLFSYGVIVALCAFAVRRVLECPCQGVDLVGNAFVETSQTVSHMTWRCYWKSLHVPCNLLCGGAATGEDRDVAGVSPGSREKHSPHRSSCQWKDGHCESLSLS